MSEQALKTAPSGAGTSIGSAASGTYRVISGGNHGADSGKNLPEAGTEKSDLARLARELTASSRNIGRDLRFQVDLKLGYAVIQVLDSETGEIIRQIPEDKTTLSLEQNGSVGIRLFDELV